MDLSHRRWMLLDIVLVVFICMYVCGPCWSQHSRTHHSLECNNVSSIMQFSPSPIHYRFSVDWLWDYLITIGRISATIRCNLKSINYPIMDIWHNLYFVNYVFANDLQARIIFQVWTVELNYHRIMIFRIQKIIYESYCE